MASSPHHRNWADLQTELLGLISEKLVLLPDYIRFGAVCKGWHFAALDNYQHRLKTCHQQPPMLLLPPADGREDHRGLYSIWERKTYSNLLTMPNATPYVKSCRGSCYGWLAVVDIMDGSIKLLNPFSGNSIQLPKILHNSKKYNMVSCEAHFRVRTVMLSCDPCSNPDDWVAVAIYSTECRLACMRGGDDSWYYLSYPLGPVIEAGFYDGQLYFMNRRYQIFHIPIQDEACWADKGEGYSIRKIEGVKKVKKLPIKLTRPKDNKFYFVELEGDLLLVRRHYSNVLSGNRERTVGFHLYKLHINEQSSALTVKCTEIKDLGGFSLFLGDNKPIGISTATIPDFQPNCIYYTADHKPYDFSDIHIPDDIGVFNLATGHVRQLYTLPPSLLSRPPTLWISPRLGAKIFN